MSLLLKPSGANTLVQELGIWCLRAFSAKSLETSVWWPRSWLQLKSLGFPMHQYSGSVVHLLTWLILPVVICLSQRLSHACLSMADLAQLLRDVLGNGAPRGRGQSADALRYVRRCKEVHVPRRVAEATALRVTEQAARHNSHDAVRPPDLIDLGGGSALHPRTSAFLCFSWAGYPRGWHPWSVCVCVCLCVCVCVCVCVRAPMHTHGHPWASIGNQEY